MQIDICIIYQTLFLLTKYNNESIAPEFAQPNPSIIYDIEL